MSALDSVLVWMLSMNREYNEKVRFSIVVHNELHIDGSLRARSTTQSTNLSSYVFRMINTRRSAKTPTHFVRVPLGLGLCIDWASEPSTFSIQEPS